MSKTKTCNKCGRNFTVHSLGEAIPDSCDNCYRTDHPVPKVPLGDCVVHNFYKGTNCVNCGYDQALDHPHPNPKDVEAWMVSLGFVKGKHGDYWILPNSAPQLSIDMEQAIFFYTIHHTALTSFRDELLAASSEIMSAHSIGLAQKALTVEGQKKNEYARGNNHAIRKWRKAIQTISERHNL